jgi:hypothetical protein
LIGPNLKNAAIRLVKNFRVGLSVKNVALPLKSAMLKWTKKLTNKVRAGQATLKIKVKLL